MSTTTTCPHPKSYLELFFEVVEHVFAIEAELVVEVCCEALLRGYVVYLRSRSHERDFF